MSRDLDDPSPSGDPPPLDAGVMTWAALLARWTDLVQVGEGWHRLHPGDAEAVPWRSSIPEIISLQSLTFALGELGRIPVEDRPSLAIADSAGRAAGRLDEIAGGSRCPKGSWRSPRTLVAVDEAVYAGLRWLLWTGPGRLRIPPIDLDADAESGEARWPSPNRARSSSPDRRSAGSPGDRADRVEPSASSRSPDRRCRSIAPWTIEAGSTTTSSPRSAICRRGCRCWCRSPSMAPGSGAGWWRTRPGRRRTTGLRGSMPRRSASSPERDRRRSRRPRRRPHR